FGSSTRSVVTLNTFPWNDLFVERTLAVVFDLRDFLAAMTIHYSSAGVSRHSSNYDPFTYRHESGLLRDSSNACMLGSDPYRRTLHSFAQQVNPAHDDEAIDLAGAALALARIEYPELEIESYLQRLSALAAAVKRKLRANPSAREVILTLNRVLFDEEGLRGNRDDYYDPRNSFLNDVLDRKLGIPITLSVVYMEVARRIGFPLAGTAMPGHFLLKHY